MGIENHLEGVLWAEGCSLCWFFRLQYHVDSTGDDTVRNWLYQNSIQAVFFRIKSCVSQAETYEDEGVLGFFDSARRHYPWFLLKPLNLNTRRILKAQPQGSG